MGPWPGAWRSAACTWQSQDQNPGVANSPSESSAFPQYPPPLKAVFDGCPSLPGPLLPAVGATPAEPSHPALCSFPACTAPQGTAPTPGSCPTWWPCAWLPSTPATKSSSTGQSPLPPGGLGTGMLPLQGGDSEGPSHQGGGLYTPGQAREVEWLSPGQPPVGLPSPLRSLIPVLRTQGWSWKSKHCESTLTTARPLR